MATSATFIHSTESSSCQHAVGSFHAPGGRFFVLDNCGCDCHFLYEEDVSDWDKPDETLTAEDSSSSTRNLSALPQKRFSDNEVRNNNSPIFTPSIY